MTAMYLSDRSPRSSERTAVTPYGLLYSAKSEYGHLQVFGYVAYVQIQKGELDNQKFDSDRRKCVFIRNSYNTRMWWVFYPPSQHISYSQDVLFLENNSYYKNDNDEFFETVRSLVPTSDFEDETNRSEKQFYDIFQQQTREDDEAWISTVDAEEGIPANDTKDRIPANYAEDRVPANEKRISANDVEKKTQRMILKNTFWRTYSLT